MNIFGVGLPEMVLILAVALLVFGPKRLPEIGRTIAKTLKMLQDASKEFETELKKEADSLSAMVEDKPQPKSAEVPASDMKDSTPESLPKGDGEPSEDAAAAEAETTEVSAANSSDDSSTENPLETGGAPETEDAPDTEGSDLTEPEVEPTSEQESPVETEVS